SVMAVAYPAFFASVKLVNGSNAARNVATPLGSGAVALLSSEHATAAAIANAATTGINRKVCFMTSHPRGVGVSSAVASVRCNGAAVGHRPGTHRNDRS